MNKQERSLLEKGLNYLEQQPPETWTHGTMENEKGTRWCAIGHLRNKYGVSAATKINNAAFRVGRITLVEVNDKAGRNRKNPKQYVINYLKKLLNLN